MDDLVACLPEGLRGEPISRVSAGLSGAGVYRVGDRHILKISPQYALTRLASDAGVGPRVVHVDEARHAVVTELVADRGFMPLVMTDRPKALALLGQTLRRVHDQPAPAGEPMDSRGFLADVYQRIGAMALPAFATAAIEGALAAEPPPRGPLVLSHNDPNPTNLVFDGERIVLLDWDTAGPNDAMWDLAAVATFLRLDRSSSLALLSAHDGGAVREVPPRFAYCRRMSAALSGSMFLMLAYQAGHPGDATAQPPTLSGRPDVGSREGKWTFGLTLVRAAAADLHSPQ